MQVVTHGMVFKAMEKWAPKSLAYDWDNVGLQIGSANVKTKRVMVTLDVLDHVVDEAIENDVNLIIAHHPLLFKPLKQINVDTVKGRLVQKLLKHDITVYAAHTNLDIANDGVNHMLANALQLDHLSHLVEETSEKLFKLAVYVPASHVEAVRDAWSEAGAGHIGEYSHCTFQTDGQGTFKPLPGTSPYIGDENELSFVAEKKLETIISEAQINKVIEKMIAVHPYEEVAYDLYPLANKGRSFGLGKIGELDKEISLESFIKQVKKAFDVDYVRFVGDKTKQVKKIAILGGSGEKFIHQAKRKGADVYITGDTTFHLAQDAQEMGLAMIDPGHYIEKIMKKYTKDYLLNTFKNISVIESKESTNPFQFM